MPSISWPGLQKPCISADISHFNPKYIHWAADYHAQSLFLEAQVCRAAWIIGRYLLQCLICFVWSCRQ
jgi:hypothetical protein